MGDSPANAALRAELLALAERDKRTRGELVASGELFAGYNPRMAAVHARNAKALERIVGEFGWPGKSLIGDDGADAAWLVLQHAIANPELQRRCLPLLKAAVEAGEAPAFQAACLEDRICACEGRPQRYGTQFDWDEHGQLSPLPLQDPERVDKLREAVGLGPLAERIEQARRHAEAEGDRPPADFGKRQKEKEAWAKSVGWL
jgi:hypothetical protein